MQKGLLSALTETWGLKPAELHQLRLLGERLFDSLSEGLSAIASQPVSVDQLKLELESSGDFFAQPKPYHFTSLGFSDEPAIILKVDLALACTIIRAAVGGDVAGLAAAAESPALTPIESRVLARVAPEVFVGAVERVLSALFAGREGLHVLFSSEGATAAAESGAGSEQLVVASVKCAIAGASAKLAFAIPLPIVIQARDRLALPRQERRPVERGADKVRNALLGARIELSAVLGSLAMSLGEVRSLGPGSVVLVQKLGHDIPRVALRCNDHALFFGTVVEDAGWYRFLVQPILMEESTDGDTGTTKAG